MAQIDKEFVVARYKESPSLWDDVHRIPGARLTIYNKGEPDERFISLPNVGREGNTWLTHIVNRYDDLANLTAFAQGNPAPHCPDLVKKVAGLNPPYPSFLSLSYVMYTAKGEPRFFDEPISPGIRNLDELWDIMFKDIPRPIDYLSPCGGQFAATKETIRRLPKSKYQQYLDLVTNRVRGPWEFESIWIYLFNVPVENVK